jgi:hypothetical protein
MNRTALLAAAAALFVVLTTPTTSGFVFLSSRWPDGVIGMHLQLGTSGVLSDGSDDWGASAEAALAAWNQVVTKVQFRIVRDSTAAIGDGNGVNNVFFSNEIYGMAFDDSVVAVTTSWSRRSARTEGDVIFNNGRSWDSYDGPLKRNVMDLRRVALHEFGHVLGLDHPDDRGQQVSAIMNSHVTSLNRLSDDDMTGARELYESVALPGRRRSAGGPPPLHIAD